MEIFGIAYGKAGHLSVQDESGSKRIGTRPSVKDEPEITKANERGGVFLQFCEEKKNPKERESMSIQVKFQM